MKIGLICLVVFLKGCLVAFLQSKGWWPDWVQRARDREDERLVLRAYKKWRKDAGPEAAADLRSTLKEVADLPRSRGSVG